MNTPILIDIGICTYRRESVIDTLASLAKLKLPFNHRLRVIVADNDLTPSAQIMVADAAKQLALDIAYVHAPAANISIARNACLDAATGDFLAFIDDDEIADADWLLELITQQRDTEVDVVLGHHVAVYPGYCKRWLVEGDFHSTMPVWVKGKIITGYCNNVLVHRSADALQGLRFREAFGVSGGEDTDYFDRAYRHGARIAYAESAITYEPVPQNRASLRWLRKRHWRYGQTHALIALEHGAKRWPLIITASAKFSFCALMTLLTAYDMPKAASWLLRASLHLGVVMTAYRQPGQSA